MATVDRFGGWSIGMAIKPSCVVAATTALTLSGEQTIDGVAVTVNDRVLVPYQNTTRDNGIYLVKASTWTRAGDFDGIRDVIPGTLVYVDRGNLRARTFWVVNSSSTAHTIEIGVDNVNLTLASIAVTGVSSYVEGTIFPIASASAFRAAIGVVSSTVIVIPSTYIEGAIFPITSWSSFQSYLSPLDRFGMSADGLTDDTTRFTSLESTYSGHKVDLGGQTYLVTSIPTGNRYFNGYFKINAGPDGFPVKYPTPDTLHRKITTIESGSRMSYGGGAGGLVKYKGVYVLRYNEGIDDSASAAGGVVAFSYDQGDSWCCMHTVKPYSTGWNILNTGILGGQLMTVVRDNGSTDIHTLYGMRMYERYEDAALTVTVTSGSVNCSIKFSTAQGFMQGGGVITGDSVNITNWSSDVGGISFSGTYTVSAVGLSMFLTATSTATSSVTNATRTCDIEFLQDGWHTKSIDGNIIGQALKIAASATAPTGVMVGKFVEQPYDRGTFYCSVAMPYPNGYTHGIAKVLYGLSDQASAAWVRTIYGATAGSECDFVMDSSGHFYGWLRSNSTANPLRFWHSSDDNFDTSIVVLSSMGTTQLTHTQPAVVLVNDNTLWTAMSGNRVPSLSTAAPTHLYFGTQRTSDAKVHGATGFEWTWMAPLYYDPNADAGDNNSPLGQCGIVDITTSKVMIAYTDMSPQVRPGAPNLAVNFLYSGQCNIRVMTANFGSTDDIETFTYISTQTINAKSTYLG